MLKSIFNPFLPFNYKFSQSEDTKSAAKLSEVEIMFKTF